MYNFWPANRPRASMQFLFIYFKQHSEINVFCDLLLNISLGSFTYWKKAFYFVQYSKPPNYRTKCIHEFIFRLFIDLTRAFHRNGAFYLNEVNDLKKNLPFFVATLLNPRKYGSFWFLNSQQNSIKLNWSFFRGKLI